MEGSSGVTRGRGSEVGGVKEALRGFFLSGKTTKKGEECGICLGVSSSVELGEEVVGVVLKALLVPTEEEKKLEERRTSLWLCGECGASLKTLTDLFHRLEELRCQFNDLRRIVGSQVILGSLGRSEEEWAGWEEDVKRVEHIFPSCVKVRMEEEEGGAIFCDSLVKEEEMELNEEVNKMIPLVLLGPQIEETTPTEFSDPLWIEEELHVKSEVDETETQNGAHEIHEDFFVEEPFVASAEVSLRSQRKQRLLPSTHIQQHSQISSSAEEVATSEKTFNDTHRQIAQVAANQKTHLPKKVKCSLCKRFFSGDLELIRHEAKFHSAAASKSHHPTGVPCTHCHLTFHAPAALKLHKLRTHLLGSTASGDPQCAFCLEFYPNEPSLIQHQRKIHFGGHSPGPQHIHCFLCRTSRSFHTPRDLQAHEESPEHKQKIRAKSSAYCDVCRLNFAWNPEALRLHLSSPEHQKEVDSIRNFDATTYCILCRKDHESGSQLYRHLRNPGHKQKALEVQENHSPEVIRTRIFTNSSRSVFAVERRHAT